MHLCLLSLEYRFKILKCSSDTFKTKQNDDALVYIVEYFVSRLLNPVTSLCPAEGDGPFDIDVYLVGSRCKEMGWLRGNGCPCWGLGGGWDSPQQLYRTSPHMCVSLWHAPDSTYMMCYSL